MSPFRTLYTRVSQNSVLLPLVIGFIYYKKLSFPFRVFLYFLVIAFFVEQISSRTLHIYGSANNMPVGHLFFLIEFAAFSIVYFLHFSGLRAMRFLIGINMVVGMIVGVADAFYINGMWNPPTLARSYYSVLVVIYALVYFYFLFKDVMQYSWEHPMFWLSIGALLYFGNNVLYFILIDYLIEKAVRIEAFSWATHGALNIIAHILYAQSFRCFRNQKVLS